MGGSPVTQRGSESLLDPMEPGFPSAAVWIPSPNPAVSHLPQVSPPGRGGGCRWSCQKPMYPPIMLCSETPVRRVEPGAQRRFLASEHCCAGEGPGDQRPSTQGLHLRQSRCVQLPPPLVPAPSPPLHLVLNSYCSGPGALHSRPAHRVHVAGPELCPLLEDCNDKYSTFLSSGNHSSEL